MTACSVVTPPRIGTDTGVGKVARKEYQGQGNLRGCPGSATAARWFRRVQRDIRETSSPHPTPALRIESRPKTLVLAVQSVVHHQWHPLGACWKCKFSGPAPAPPTRNWCFIKMPGAGGWGIPEHIMFKQNPPTAPCTAGSCLPLWPDVLANCPPLLWLHPVLAAPQLFPPLS